jgi:hypothetical protein
MLRPRDRSPYTSSFARVSLLVQSAEASSLASSVLEREAQLDDCVDLPPGWMWKRKARDQSGCSAKGWVEMGLLEIAQVVLTLGVEND